MAIPLLNVAIQSKMDTNKIANKDIEERKTSECDLEANLKEILERESREERRANGRLVAMIVGSSVIFLAIYQAWIRKTAVLAGILVPALIMILYGGWVVILAKRDKRKREMFEKKIEEIARQEKLNKAQLGETLKKSAPKNTTQLTNKDEKPKHDEDKPSSSRRKERSEKKKDSSGKSSSASKTSKTSSHRKKLRTKRPSIRQKLFRQNAVIETPNAKFVITCKEERKKHPFVRTSSVP